MSLRVIFDTCEPRDEVLRGDLRDEMFAARLRDVMEDRVPPGPGAQGLLLGQPVQFDRYTDWYLMPWDAFKAEEFPGDEARKLALGLDLEREIIADKRLVTKKAARVVIQQPKARRKREMVDPDRRTFECWIDAVQTAMLLYEEDGARLPGVPDADRPPQRRLVQGLHSGAAERDPADQREGQVRAAGGGSAGGHAARVL